MPKTSADAGFTAEVTVSGTSAGKPFTVTSNASDYAITAKSSDHALAIELVKNDKFLAAFGKSPTIDKVTLNFRPADGKGETRTLNFTKLSAPTATAKSDGAIHFTLNFRGVSLTWTDGGKTLSDDWHQ